MDKVQEKFDEFVKLTTDTLTQFRQLMDQEHEKIASEKKDKLLLDDRENALITRAAELDARAKEQELTIEKLREKQTLLDMREKQINAERERLQNLINNF